MAVFWVCSIGKQRSSADCRVEAAGGVAPERKIPNSRIEAAGREL
jgi:hypothetical protein